MATTGGQVLAFVMIGGGIAIGVTESASWAQGMWLVLLGVFLYSVASGSARWVLCGASWVSLPRMLWIPDSEQSRKQRACFI